ncbi:MAG TPA: hypothetical protein VK447_19375 [Myxococcaceae bacterium]|nr:hypothetical protein [Myxococcaceae bacterium]
MTKRFGGSWLALLALMVGLAPGRARAEDAPVAEVPARSPELFPAHRYTFLGGGLLALGGLGFGFYARTEAQRAASLPSASASAAALDRSRQAAATANVMYGLAGAALIYGIVLELLPPPAAEKASLTFHF